MLSKCIHRIHKIWFTKYLGAWLGGLKANKKKFIFSFDDRKKCENILKMPKHNGLLAFKIILPMLVEDFSSSIYNET